jgi:magnesium transporter
MFYQIINGLNPITMQEYDKNILTLGLISLEEFSNTYNLFEFSEETLIDCQSNTRQSHGLIGTYDSYHFGIISGIETKHLFQLKDRIAIFIKTNLFLIVVIEDNDSSIQKDLEYSLKQINFKTVTLERLVFGFLERFIYNNYAILEDIETELGQHEDRIDHNRLNKDFNLEVTGIRKRLLLLDNYYEQLIIIGEELVDNSIDIFDEVNLRYFRLFSDRAGRLSQNTRRLNEYCTHVRDAYNAQLDYNLNSIMKLFTVVTTIFLPLTLIVGWYGMNLNMPEFHWKYGYLYVILLCISVVILFIYYFKKKKFL